MGGKQVGSKSGYTRRQTTDRPYDGAVTYADFADEEAYAFLEQIPGTHTYYGAAHQIGKGEGNIWFGFGMRIEVGHFRVMYHNPTVRESLLRLGRCVERVKALHHPIRSFGISVNLGYTPPGTLMRGMNDEPQLLTAGWWWDVSVGGVGCGAAQNAVGSEEAAWIAVARATERLVEGLERSVGIVYVLTDTRGGSKGGKGAMWRISEFFRELWEGIGDDWVAASRLGRAEVITVGVMVLSSAVYIPLYLRYGVVVHPPYPHPGWALDQIVANQVHAIGAAPLQAVFNWLWVLTVLVATGTFLAYCVVSIGSGIRRLVRRRQARRGRQDRLAKYGVDGGAGEVKTDVWERALADSGVEDL